MYIYILYIFGELVETETTEHIDSEHHVRCVNLLDVANVPTGNITFEFLRVHEHVRHV